MGDAANPRARFVLVPCESEPALALVWDKVAEQVIDVLDAEEIAAYGLQDGLA